MFKASKSLPVSQGYLDLSVSMTEGQQAHRPKKERGVGGANGLQADLFQFCEKCSRGPTGLHPRKGERERGKGRKM